MKHDHFRYKGGDIFTGFSDSVKRGHKKYTWYIEVGGKEYIGEAETIAAAKTMITSKIKASKPKRISVKRKPLKR